MARRPADFPRSVKEVLAARVGYRCSNPDCTAPTVGPSTTPGKRKNDVGMAAHIEAASPKGARYNPEMTQSQRRSYENGIWMCYTHGKQVDGDESLHSVQELRAWKDQAEALALRELGRRPSAPPVSMSVSVHSHGGAGGAGGAGTGGGGGGGAVLGGGGAGGEPPARKST